MSKVKAKVLRFKQISVEAVFEKENELISQLQNGNLDQALLLWQSDKPTLVLPSGNKWQQTEALETKLKKTGWQLHARKTGGAPVPQCEGVINVSYMYVLEEHIPYSIPNAYKDFCAILSSFFEQFNIKVETHATPGSYCDGDYNLNIKSKKIVGTAQRVLLKKGGGKIVLAQACILVNANMPTLVSPVNLCYEHHQQDDRAIADVHTSLFEHTQERPDIDELFQRIFTSFINHQKHKSS